MKRRTYVYLATFLLVVVTCSLISTSQADWTNLGLYGGQIYDMAIDPDDVNKMFAAAYLGDGLYRTLDGGNTWDPVLTGEEGGALDGEATFRNNAVWAVDIAPSNDNDPDNNIVWAVHNYWAAKSTSGGADESWVHFSNGAMQDDCDGCPKDSTPNQPGSEQFRYCHTLAIDPFNPQIVYIGTGGAYGSDKKGAVYKTENGGGTWKKLGMTVTGFDPDGTGTLYEPRNLNNEFYSKVIMLLHHPTQSNVIFAVDFNEILGEYLAFLYISTDGGLTWNWDIGLQSFPGESGLVVNPDEPNVVYFSSVGGIARVEYQTDSEGNVLWDANVLQTYPIATGGSNVRALAFDPRNSSILYAATGSNDNYVLRKSSDGGLTFSDLYYHDQQYLHLAPHPTDSSVMFGGERLKGVYRGDFANGDYTWSKISNGIHSIKISDIAIDPNDSSHYLAATMAGVYEQQGGHDNPWTSTAALTYTEAFSVEFDESDSDGSSFLAGGESRLYRTTDHGTNWSLSNHLGYPHFVNDIAIDPINPNNVFITTRYPGEVYKSTDGGANLTKVLDSSNLYDFGAVALVVNDPFESTHIYAGGGNYFGADVPGNLYESTTGGGSGSWSPILPAVNVNALLIDPDDPGVIYVGCGYSGGTEVPLYKSTDGGSTWYESYQGIPGEPVRYGIWGNSANNVFVLKHTGSVAQGGHDDKNILHYNGSDWVDQDIGVSTQLYGIWGSSGTDIFAVGEAGTIVHYNGSAWSPMPNAIDTDLSDVAGSASDNVYAVGKGGLILHYTGGGWSALDSGTFKDLSAVWSTDDGAHVFAVGAYGTITHTDDGTTWFKQSTGVTTALQGIWGSSVSNVYAVGKEGTILHYNGSTWLTMSSNTSENLTSVWGTSDGSQVYAVGENGTIMHHVEGTWFPVSSGTNATLYGIWGTAANHVYAVGQYGSLLSYNGSTWSDISIGFNEFADWNGVTDLKFKVEDGNRLIYASTTRQGIYASSDNGNTWTSMTTPPYDVYALATGSVVVGTQGGVLAMSGYGLLYGQVTDNAGVPIAGVTINTDIGKSTISASDGRWSIGLKAGTYNVSANIPGYGQVIETNVPIYDATGTFVDFEFNGRSIYVSIANREVLGTNNSFIGLGGRVTPTIGNFTWSLGNGSGELTALYGENATLLIEPDLGHHADVVVDGQLHGTDLVEFINVTEGHTIEATFENNPPDITDNISDIDPQSKPEDSDPWPIDLTPYETDLENSGSDLNWSVSGINESLFSAVVTDIPNDVITFTPVPDAHGSDEILLTLTDAGGLTDSKSITVTLTPDNDAPIVTDIQGQTIAEGGAFATINLDDFVSDVDNTDAEMTWTTSGQTDLVITIDSSRVATVTVPDVNWNGQETITFRATDTGGEFSEDSATFTVNADNDAPNVTNIPNQTIQEGSTFATINLDNFVSDVDNTDAEMTWTTSGQTDLVITIDSSRIATVTVPDVNWNGQETITFRATDTGGEFSEDSATFTVNADNDAPNVTNIPNQTIQEGSTFATINLDNFVSDVDNTDAEMTWTTSGQTDLVITIDSSRIATVTVPDVNWNGQETITFRATDTGGEFSEDSATFTVNADNDAPNVTNIPNQTIQEGSTFATINLDNFVSDVDNTDAEMTWTTSGQTDLVITIDSSRIATVTVPDVNWNGQETITFRATDTGGEFSEDSATFTVNADNDAPNVTNIPNQTIQEGSTFATINLDNFVSDVDNTDAEMTWTTSGQTDLVITIDSSRIATVTVPDVNWNGQETITFRATDTGGEFSEDSATFTVNADNDAPDVGDILGQTILEGSTFATINLDNFVSDVDNTDAEMTWTTSGQTDLVITIDSSRIATVTVPDVNWNGQETITFRATDTGGEFSEDSATFTVNADNDAPDVGDILGQTILEGSTFARINLDNFVSDVDNTDAEMTWTTSGQTDLVVTIDSSRVATITMPDVNWNGQETIIFRATDPDGDFDDDGALFTVTSDGDAPVVTGIPAQTILEGNTFATINLDDFVSDVDNTDAEMTWTTSGQTDLVVTIDSSRVATITMPDVNWNGEETVTFRATDPLGLFSEDSATFTVNADNDAPNVTNIPNQTIQEGSTFATINLDNFVSDVDNTDAEMTWTTSGQTDLVITIDSSRIATVTVPDVNWNGQETITFRATDTGGEFSEDSATFTVNADNDAPDVGDILGQTILEGSTFATINLDNFVSDVDNTDAEMTWTTSGQTDLVITIDSSRIATVTVPDVNWNGQETITFRATDTGGEFSEDSATFTVNADNDAPDVGDILGQTILEGSTFATINLDNFVSDVDNTDAEMTWTTSGQTDLVITIDSSRIATVTVPDVNWNGQETITFRATDTGGEFSEDSATFTVNADNDAPDVGDILGQTILEGSTFATINLDNFVSDVDNTDAEMTWTTSGQTDLVITIDSSRVATITMPDVNWNGQETIIFRATDPEGKFDVDGALFMVISDGDAPVVIGIPDQTILEGNTFATINLDDYVSDVDNTDEEITWTSSNPQNLSVSIVDRVATVGILDADWNGEETITFRATDTLGLFDVDDAMFKVNPANDAPVVNDIPDQTILEGSTFATINLDDYVSDVDNTDAEMTWTYNGNSSLSVSISSGIARYIYA